MNIDQLMANVKAEDEFLSSLAYRHLIDPLTLRSCLLLHLPQFDKPNIWHEAKIIAKQIEELQAPYSEWLMPINVKLKQLEFVIIEEELAKVFHERFHYVHSFRPGLHFAMIYGDRIVCQGSVAKSDLSFLPHADFVLSRFFAFRWAPENIFSYFHAAMRKHLIQEYNTKLIASFINPNIGFSGKSHLGAQYKIFGYEYGTKYAYVDDKYRTMRYIRAHNQRFTLNRIELNPLMVLVNKFQKGPFIIPSMPFVLHRPKY